MNQTTPFPLTLKGKKEWAKSVCSYIFLSLLEALNRCHSAEEHENQRLLFFFLEVTKPPRVLSALPLENTSEHHPSPPAWPLGTLPSPPLGTEKHQ